MKSIEVGLQDFVIYDGRRLPCAPRAFSRNTASGTCSWRVTIPTCAFARRLPATKTSPRTSTFFWSAMRPSRRSLPSPRRGLRPPRPFALPRSICSSRRFHGFARFPPRADIEQESEIILDWSHVDAADFASLCETAIRAAFPRTGGPFERSSRNLSSGPSANGVAQIAITLDLEMSRNFPTWDQEHWDYEKGNLDASTKRYSLEAARRVKASGGVIHFFAVGQTMEQEDVGWLREIVAQGHPVGNHTYDHVNVKATRTEDIQFRFRRAPWLIEGKNTGRGHCRKYPPG